MLRASAIVFGAALSFLAAPALGDVDDPARQAGMHHEVKTTVSKISSGFIFVEPTAGLRPRAIGPAKADRLGLYDVRPGDAVLLFVDSGNVLLDAHKAGRPGHGHRMVAGQLSYADVYWSEVKLTTPDGEERFDVDSLAGNKLTMFGEGAAVVLELDEDNMMIDIHRSR